MAPRAKAPASQRLDEALVAAGLADSRSRAKRLILAGQVRVAGAPAGKPGTTVAAGTPLEVEEAERFVSRGGDKLHPVLEASRIGVEGRVALDIGASTGGFTDCLLQAGARAVVAVDVGYGQLAWRLRQDERVHALERTNARNLEPTDLPELPEAPSLLVMDVSFIGLAKVLPAVTAACAAECDALILVKPQFEAGQEHVAKGGVVRSGRVRRDAVAAVAADAEKLGWAVVAARPSPLRGPAGNWECFLQLRRAGDAVSRADWLARLDVPDDEGSP